MLRRIKTDVETSLPSKKEILLYAQMTPLQKKLDKQLREKTLQVRKKKKEEEEERGERERARARAFLSFLGRRPARPVPPFATQLRPDGCSLPRAPSAPQAAPNAQVRSNPVRT